MVNLKQLLKSPYLYIFLITYFGVWLIWTGIKLPSATPNGIISYLPTIHYNPTNNLLRFLLAILLPPAACSAYVGLHHLQQKMTAPAYSRSLSALIITASILLALAMGIFQNSTNPANNQPGEYGGPYSHALLDTFHEGETLGPAISYQQKDLKPYRDFVIIHGVFQDPLRTVIAFHMFGKSIGAERAFATLLVMLTLVLYYGLLLVLFRGNIYKSALAMSILAMLMLPSGVVPLLNSFFNGIQFPFRDIATIVFLVCAIVSLRLAVKKRISLLLGYSTVIGFIVVTGFGNSIDRAMYIAALSLVWLAMIAVLLPIKSTLKIMAAFVVGCLIGLPVFGLAIKWAFSDFMSYLLSMSHYKEYLDGIVFTQPNLATSVALLLIGSCIACVGLYLMQLGVRVRKQPNTKEKLFIIRDTSRRLVIKYHTPILLFVTGVFFLRSAIGRADFAHFAYSIQWLYLFITFVATEYGFRVIKKSRAALYFCVVILMFSMLGQYAVLVKKIDIRNDAFPINVQDRDLLRPDYIQTAQFLKQNLHGNDTFVTLTSEGSWYYLVGKPSPIRYYVIWYAYTSPERQEIAHSLTANIHIRYVITNNNWTSDFDYVPNPVRFPEVYTALNRYYMPLTGIGQQTIWVRK